MNLTLRVQYGKVWVFTIPRKPLDFVLIDPAAVNHVLKANFDNYIKVPGLHDVCGVCGADSGVAG
jgi:hypothetical protein